MPLVFSEDVTECVPFRIGSNDPGAGPRMGGAAPEGITPRALPAAQYFATLPLSTDPARDLSIFFAMAGDTVAAPSGAIHDSFIEVITHDPARRSTTAAPASPLPAHSLLLLPPKKDKFVGDDGAVTVEPHHKLGGRPFLLHNEPRLEDEVQSLFAAGYHHVVQFDFPVGGGDALVDGPWPFVDGVFHLFGRPSLGAWEWRWFWDL